MSMSNIRADEVVDTTQISQDTFAPGYYQQSIKANVPRIYNGSSNQFTPGDQYYGVITGRDDTSHFGRSVDVDFEDHRIVGGGPEYDNGRGYIAVYDWLYSGTPAVGAWNLIGNYINGPDPGGGFGECVSMDYDGQRVIVGAPRTNSGAGAVHVVDYNVNTGNFSITRSISAGAGVTSFGFSVSIAGDKADRFVVGAPNVNTIYVYEYSTITSTWTETYSNVGTDSAIVNDVPIDNVGTRQTLYPKFNGYGYSVDMSGFGEHIAVGAPGTAVVQLRASGAMGTTTPGPVNHTVGEHAISSTGPHYTGGTGTGTGNMNMEGAPGGSVSNPITQSTLNRNTGGGWSCGSSRLAHNTGASGGHPFSCRKLWNDGMTTLGTGVAEYGTDNQSETVPEDSCPYLDGVSSTTDRDNWFYPNFQTGNVRMLRCPDGGSWSSGVTQVGTVLKGFDNAIVPTVDRSGNPRSSYEISLRSTGLHYWRTNRNGDSLPGFGQTVQMSADGSRLTVSAPTEAGHQYYDRAMQGNIYTYSFNKITGNYEDPLKDQDADGKGYEFVHDQTNCLYGMGTSLTEDGSRIFGSCFDHLQFLKVHDFSGKTYFMSSPIIVTHNTDADIYGGTLSSPIVRQTEGSYGDPVPRGYMSGWRTAAKSGKICAVSMPAYPECFGSRNSNDSPTATSATIQPNNGKGRGIIFIYRFPLTQVVSGNSLFEGSVKCMDLTIGSTTNSLSPAKLHFGGRLGEANTEQASTIETRWLGQQRARYQQNLPGKHYHDHELLVCKFHGEDPVTTGWPVPIKYRHWTENQYFGSRIRLKAPKIEFQLQHVEVDSSFEKYNEHTCVTITNNSRVEFISDIGFGGGGNNSGNTNGSRGSGHHGPNDGNNGWGELRQLMCIRTGTCNSRVNAGLMLVAARTNVMPILNNPNVSGETGNEGRWVPDDGCHYTFAPGNDGWLRLLTETLLTGSGNNLENAQPNTHFAYYDPTGGTTKTTDNTQVNYAGLAVGHLYVAHGSIQYPSDDRLKHFEEEIPNCLELINQLNPYKYKKTQIKYTEDYTGDVGTEDKDWNWEIGLIAQDIKKIPYLEFTVKDPNPSSEDVYSLNYNTFIGVCLQGIKDLHNRHQPELAKVATLQSDLTIEKEKVATLQSDLTVEKEKVATLQSDVAVEKEKVATLQTDLTIEKEKVATLQTDVDREKLKTLNLQERILVMEQAYHALLERVSDLENS